MTPKFAMACGCIFLVDEDAIIKKGRTLEWYKQNNKRPPLKVDWNNLPNCPRIWEMLADGFTLGVFQLESSLGRTYSKKLRPESIEHLSALGAILRPGSMEDKDDNGVSTTEHYCLRKNKQEPVVYPHESLTEALKVSYGLNIYQEQALEIAKIIAGFNLGEADTLRRGIGKKLPEVIAKCKTQFIEGAKKVGLVTEEKAREIFGGIEASQRYSFNKSHSFSYALNGFKSAFMKAHFPLEFFCSYLVNAKNEQKPFEEIAELANEAKIFGINIISPDISALRKHFHIVDDKTIRYGLVDIRGIGSSHFEKIKELDNLAKKMYDKPLGQLSWNQFLPLSINLNKTTVEGLIMSGALRGME